MISRFFEVIGDAMSDDFSVEMRKVASVKVNLCEKKWPLVLIFIPKTKWRRVLTPQLISLQWIIILRWIPMVLMIFEDLKPITPWGSSLALMVMLTVILFPRTPICPTGPVLESLNTNISSIYKEMNINVWRLALFFSAHKKLVTGPKMQLKTLVVVIEV